VKQQDRRRLPGRILEVVEEHHVHRGRIVTSEQLHGLGSGRCCPDHEQ
jgi:hypothetical protein